MNRMDLQKQAFYKRVEAGYETLIAADPARWQRIDAVGSIREVQTRLAAIVDQYLSETAAR